MAELLAGLFSAAIDRVHGLFIEPAATAGPVAERATGAQTRETQARQVEVAVVGLSRGCGASTISAALALAFAEAQRPANLIALDGGSRDAEQTKLGSVRVWHVPSALMAPNEVAQYGGVVARVAGGRSPGSGVTATVWDLSASHANRGAQVLPDVDVVVALARGDSDPALADLASELLAQRCPRLLLAANRAAAGMGWDTCAEVRVPDSRVGAKLVARGRLPGGLFGDALRELATLVEAPL